jgi:hypothetical protein
MKATDLMIGDWVLYDGKPNIITEVSEIIHGEATVCFVGNNYMANMDEIEPIPLTPEILEKNGFTKSTPPPGIHAKCYELDNKKDKYNLTIADYNRYKRLLLNVDSEDSECFNIKCDYVHELQHALRLCRIKKEIEL